MSLGSLTIDLSDLPTRQDEADTLNNATTTVKSFYFMGTKFRGFDDDGHVRGH